VVETKYGKAPFCVATGVLSQREFESADASSRDLIEASATKLLSQHGWAWVQRNRQCLRGGIAVVGLAVLDYDN
jgi:hypothetical protein